MAQQSEHDVATSTTEPCPPPIAAAFLVTFDNRKGYTITWQKSLDNVNLDGAVEFKSLPSGLHNVDEDLVYFIYDEYAGISAFLRKGDEEAARNARMLSVGVLVPLEAGRMGKSFMYAEQLKELARTLIDDQATTTPMETFWDKHRMQQKSEDENPISDESMPGYQKLRTLSTTTLTTPSASPSLPPHHPALALPNLLRTFGPLIFPLFRACLLQKRILILGEAPVEPNCDFVYCLSVLSSVSRLDAAQTPNFDPSKLFVRPLFNIGIPDIATLEESKGPWIACTTDDVLATKPHLFDILVIMPNSSASQKHGPTTYPELIISKPDLATKFPRRGQRASRRDARRFAALRTAMQTLPSGASSAVDQRDRNDEDDENDAASDTSSLATIGEYHDTVEPTPWSVIAYTSLVWWASAGDRRSGLMEAEELSHEQDAALLRDSLAEEGTTQEFAMVAYFHKLTSLIFSVLASASRRSGEEDQERYRDDEDANSDDHALLSSKDDEEEPVEITEEDVRAMGLDVWSHSDQEFIEELVLLCWRRRASVKAGIIECCGIRIL